MESNASPTATHCDVDCADLKALRQYLVSTSSVSALGANAEAELQHTPDYVRAKDAIFKSQPTIAMWDAIGGYSNMASTALLGMFGVAFANAVNDGNFTNPLLIAAGGSVAGTAGLAIYSRYQTSILHNINNFNGNEAAMRKNAEYQKLMKKHDQEIALVSSEHTARRVGEEVEHAMERVMSKYQPSPAITSVHTVTCNQAQGIAVQHS